MTNKQKYSGIIPPLVTPLKDNEELDVNALHKLLEHCIDGGVSGIFVNGTSGEAMRVTDKVWEDNTREVLKSANEKIPVFCGAIDSSTSRVIEKIKKIEDMGGTIAVCTPPFYLASFGQDEILRHFEKICKSTKIDIAVYNIPETTHVNILPETIVELTEFENIVAYKDSTANWQQLQRVLFLCKNKDMAILNGAEELCACAMIYGSDGCIPGLANFFPDLFVRLYRACKAGNIKESFEIQEQIYNIRKSIFVNGCWMSGMKFLVKAFRLGTDGISVPLLNFTESQEQEALMILRSNGVVI